MLEPTTLYEALEILNEIDKDDNDDERSTLIYDKNMWGGTWHCWYMAHTNKHVMTIDAVPVPTITGVLCLKDAGLGIWLLWSSLYKEYRGRGLSKEAVFFGLKYAFDHGAVQVKSDVMKRNTRSMAIHNQYATFDCDGRTLPVKGKLEEVVTFKLTKDEFYLLTKGVN